MATPHEQAERQRLSEAWAHNVPWRKWGPYLSERQWGTVREDYSNNGDAWSYFSHEQARSRAYHWGEDGLVGFSDEKQRLCFPPRSDGTYATGAHSTATKVGRRSWRAWVFGQARHGRS